MFKKLWNDERGAIVSTELLLLMTVLTVGMVPVLQNFSLTLNDEFVQTGATIRQIGAIYRTNALNAIQTQPVSKCQQGVVIYNNNNVLIEN